MDEEDWRLALLWLLALDLLAAAVSMGLFRMSRRASGTPAAGTSCSVMALARSIPVSASYIEVLLADSCKLHDTT